MAPVVHPRSTPEVPYSNPRVGLQSYPRLQAQFASSTSWWPLSSYAFEHNLGLWQLQTSNQQLGAYITELMNYGWISVSSCIDESKDCYWTQFSRLSLREVALNRWTTYSSSGFCHPFMSQLLVAILLCPLHSAMETSGDEMVFLCCIGHFLTLHYLWALTLSIGKTYNFAQEWSCSLLPDLSTLLLRALNRPNTSLCILPRSATFQIPPAWCYPSA